MGPLKIIINQERCRGCGLCVNICDEVFQYDSDGSGKIRIKDEFMNENPSTGSVPENLSCAKRAVKACLIDAITIER